MIYTLKAGERIADKIIIVVYSSPSVDILSSFTLKQRHLSQFFPPVKGSHHFALDLSYDFYHGLVPVMFSLYCLENSIHYYYSIHFLESR